MIVVAPIVPPTSPLKVPEQLVDDPVKEAVRVPMTFMFPLTFRFLTMFTPPRMMTAAVGGTVGVVRFTSVMLLCVTIPEFVKAAHVIGYVLLVVLIRLVTLRGV